MREPDIMKRNRKTETHSALSAVNIQVEGALDMEEIRRGDVRIADQVIAVIAGMTAQDVPGIAPMASGLYEGIAKRVSGKSASKGVEVTIQDGEALIELTVAVQYGTKIDAACRMLQEKVKEAVERLTGLAVREVNVRVEGIEAV